MNLFRRKEKRTNDGTVGISDALLKAILDGSSVITKEQALMIPTLNACIELIAGRISTLPIKLFREEGKKVIEITEDKRLDLLNHDTGDTINAAEMKKLWVRDYFLGKGAYTYIERNLFNDPVGLFYVDESRVAVIPNADPIHKNFSINVNGRTYFPYQFLKILRNTKGFGVGVSIIEEDPLALAIYYNTMRFENANIRKGGNKRGFLKARSTVGEKEMEVLKEAWRDLYSNSNDNADNIVVLNDGVDFQEASSTSVELQLNENKQTNAAEICKLFCMPLDVLNGRATEVIISQFVQNCLTPPINTIEAALDRDLLTEAEKEEHYYFAFDTSELTRGDFASRMNGYAVALQNNIYQLDEIREKEDLPPLGFNYIRLGLDTVLLDPATGQIYTPNTDKTAKMGVKSGLTNEEERGILELREREAIFGDGHKIVGNISVGGGGSSGSGGGSSGEGESSGESIDKSGESDITESEGMCRKYDSGKFVPMPNEQFRRIKKRFKAHGGIIQQNDETDVYLIKKHVEGITYNENTILLMKKPSRASVFEELIHTAQYRDGKIGATRKSRVICEIEAQKKLLKYAKAYKLTSREIEQTKRALSGYEKELEEINKNEV